MKGAMRLAQSLYQQAIEYVGFFEGFSRRPGTDSGASQKRDSQVDWRSPESGFWCVLGRKWQIDGDLLEKAWKPFGRLDCGQCGTRESVHIG
jgi:hypothetical protein